MSNSSSPYSATKAKSKGPGDARPTATQVLQHEGLLTLPNRLTGKTVLITGGTSGLGLEVAMAMQQTGAKVFISGRCDTAKGEQIAAVITSCSPQYNKSTFPVQFVQIEQSDLDSVKAGAEDFLSRSNSTLNLFICNAGVMAPPTRTLTKQGHEMQFCVNHLAHFLLFKKLRPALLASSTDEFVSRVVTVSSSTHRASGLMPNSDYDFETVEYNPLVGYWQTKTANIYMADEIDRRYDAEGVRGLSVHPGVIIDTGLARNLPNGGEGLWEILAQDPTFTPQTKSVLQGAGAIVWTAVTASLEGKGGLYTEDCEIGQPTKAPPERWWEPGTGTWCYDKAAEAKLWSDSTKMVEEWF